MMTESESVIQAFSVRMTEGPNADCKRSATYSPRSLCEFRSLCMPGECKFVQWRKLIVFDGRGTVAVLNIGFLYSLSAFAVCVTRSVRKEPELNVV